MSWFDIGKLVEGFSLLLVVRSALVGFTTDVVSVVSAFLTGSAASTNFFSEARLFSRLTNGGGFLGEPGIEADFPKRFRKKDQDH